VAAYELVNTALGGDLGHELKAMREGGLTFDEMAASFARRGFKISRETVRRWLAKAEAAA